MKLNISDRLNMLIEICLATAFGGFVYQIISEKVFRTEGIMYGTLLGLLFWILEFLFFHKIKDRLLKLPLIITIVLKGIIYVLMIFFVITSVGFVVGLIQGKTIEEFYEYLIDKELIILVGYVLLMYIFLSFYVQLSHFFDHKVLLNFLLGKYRKPVKEERIFMFLDLKSSTRLAEKLGLETYYELLNDFFHEITEPVRCTNSEIYQYVGDEVVFTWRTDDGLANANCLNLFF